MHSGGGGGGVSNHFTSFAYCGGGARPRGCRPEHTHSASSRRSRRTLLVLVVGLRAERSRIHSGAHLVLGRGISTETDIARFEP